MSDTPQNPMGGAEGLGETGPNPLPSLRILAQYLKDLSFENPRAPEAFQGEKPPTMDVNVDVNARDLTNDQYEVELSVAARAERDDNAIFVVETSYAGVFEIKNAEPEQLEMAMLVECPRLLFPFMRQIVADATRNGNYPPLMLQPIDFLGIYLSNAEKKARQASAAGPTAAP